MIGKLEDMMGFIFKAVKWIIMIGLIVFTVIMYKSCQSTVDVLENAKIEASSSKRL